MNDEHYLKLSQAVRVLKRSGCYETLSRAQKRDVDKWEEAVQRERDRRIVAAGRKVAK